MMSWWRRNRERYRTLLAEFGAIAITTHATMWVLVYSLATLGIFMGIRSAGAAEIAPVEAAGVASAGGVGLVAAAGAAYVFTEAVGPLRLAFTVVATPLVARFVRRWRARR